MDIEDAIVKKLKSIPGINKACGGRIYKCGGGMDDMRMDCIVKICKAYYEMPDNSTGGNLHIVLDDDNIEREHIIFCLAESMKEGDFVGEAIAQILLKMSDTERERLISRYSEYSE